MASHVTGGWKLNTALRDIAARIGAPQEVRVGFLEGSTESDGTSMPLVAALDEFGVPAHGQPPRPYFRGMIERHKDEWPEQLGKVLVHQDYNATIALGLMGQKIEAELVQSIRDLVSPPLAPSTIERKGFDKPLIDTGDMWKGVASEVRKT